MDLQPKVYIDLRDWWVGYYRGEAHHYVCLIPTVVIRWSRKRRAPSFRRIEPGQAPEPREHRNVTAETQQEERPTARQTTARFMPRTRNYTTKKHS